MNCIEQADADPESQAIVIICDGRTFIAGADIREFGMPPQAPHLPDKGVPGQLKADADDELRQIDNRLSADDFYTHGADLSTLLTGLEKLVSDAADKLIIEQKERIKSAEQDLKGLSEWSELTQEEQNNTLNQLDELRIEVESNLKGLQRLVNHEFDIQSSINDLKNGVTETGRDRIPRIGGRARSEARSRRERIRGRR